MSQDSTDPELTAVVSGDDEAAGIPLIGLTRVAPVRHGGHRLIGRLGHGGMAEVFLAVSEGLSGFRKLIVVKRIHPLLAEEVEFVQMFLDEARLAARLSHPHIVQTYEVGMWDGVPFMAMEYLEGQSLGMLLKLGRKRGRPIPSRVLVGCLVDVLAGLHAAHTLRDFRGKPLHVVHRDVSPSNVFVTYAGVTKILDFGVAKARTKLTVTQAGHVRGKTAYMAPEQARGGLVDGRADVWSVGVLMWEGLAGRRLFTGATRAITVDAVLKADLDELIAQLGHRIDSALIDVVRRALSRDLKQRYQSAEEMKRDLSIYLAKSGRPHRQEVAEYMTNMFSDQRLVQSTVLGEILSDPDVADGDAEAPAAQPAHAAGNPSRPPAAPAPPAMRRQSVWRSALVLVSAMAAAVALAWALQRMAHRSETRPAVVSRAAERRAPTLASSPSRAAAPTVTASPVPGGSALLSSSSDTASPRQHRAARRARRRATPTAPAAEPMPSPPATPAVTDAAETGLLSLATTPWAEVSLEGRVLGTTPLIRVRVPAGTHALVLRNPERGTSVQYRVTIRPGEHTRRRFAFE